jgi:uncharacterized small protein (DUF1192 family)
LPNDNEPTDWELFQAAIKYIDDRIAWLQAERNELLRDEIERVRAELAARRRQPDEHGGFGVERPVTS